jgi:hypothetical protein
MACSSQECSQSRFTGDRYQRFSQGALVLADDPALAGGVYPFNREGLLSFVTSIAQRGLLDQLSEREADLISMMVLLDYHNGPGDMSERLHLWIAGDHDAMATDRAWAVASVLAATLALLCERLAADDPK